MSTDIQLLNGQYSGPWTTLDLVDQWGPSWLQSQPSESSPNGDAIEPEPAHWETCDPSEVDAPHISTLDPLAPDDFEWGQLNDRDLAYLTAPRGAEPCPWCSRRTGHSEACTDLRLEWEVEMPFGKWKGRKLSQVPRDYLEWLQRKHGITSDLRDAVKFQLYGDEA